MNLADLLDTDLLHAHIAGGLIRVQRHPTEPLRILNYTQRCQWAHAWDPVTRICRGLIVDDDDGIVARPLEKFFNLSEHQGVDPHAGPLHLEPPIAVYEKLDGSLGVAFRQPSDGRVAWATRGSFTSEQALWATAFWRAREAEAAEEAEAAGVPVPELIPDLSVVTVLAEIIYPGNRIVVDYGDATQLVLLAVLDIESGRHLFPPTAGAPPLEAEQQVWTAGSITSHMGYLDDVGPGTLPEIDNAEGFVLLGANDVRVKVKFPEYLRLHALLTGITARTIWEHLRTGTSIDRMRESVPDEFLAWVDRTVDELHGNLALARGEVTNQYEKLLRATGLDPDAGITRDDRKAFAIEAAKGPHAHAMFLLLDGNDEKLDTYLWAQVRPERTTPFTVDPDEVQEA